MTEAGFPTHDLPPHDLEARASPPSSLPDHNDSGELNSNTVATVPTATLMGASSTSGVGLASGSTPLLHTSDNLENGGRVAVDSKPLLSLSPPRTSAGGEAMKESFLVLARTPDPDVDGDGGEEKGEEDSKTGVDASTRKERRESDVPGRDVGDVGSSQRDPPLASPVLQGTASGDDSGYDGREDETRVEENTHDGSEAWHPLSPIPRPSERGQAVDEKATSGQDATIVVEEGDVVDSHGLVLYPEDEFDEKPSDINSPRRASHLRLDLKPASPQPWDLVEPPETNGHPGKEEVQSPNGSRFHSMQSRHRALVPKSSYYFGPPPPDSAYGTPPIGQIGVHHPREILRIERDYTGGELTQFAPIYPLELEGRITPTQFLESINAINEILISAHSLRHSFFDNMLSIFTLQLARTVTLSHYEKEMRRLRELFDYLNTSLFNPVGLNLLWPRKVAFLYLELEYY